MIKEPMQSSKSTFSGAKKRKKGKKSQKALAKHQFDPKCNLFG